MSYNVDFSGHIDILPLTDKNIEKRIGKQVMDVLKANDTYVQQLQIEQDRKGKETEVTYCLACKCSDGHVRSCHITTNDEFKTFKEAAIHKADTYDIEDVTDWFCRLNPSTDYNIHLSVAKELKQFYETIAKALQNI